MAQIGTFDYKDDKYYGTINTLTINTRAEIVKSGLNGDKKPTHYLMVNQVQVGAGWLKENRSGDGSHISIKFDDPSFAEPVQCRLVQSGDVYALYWTRDDNRTRTRETTETAQAA